MPLYSRCAISTGNYGYLIIIFSASLLLLNVEDRSGDRVGFPDEQGNYDGMIGYVQRGVSVSCKYYDK